MTPPHDGLPLNGLTPDVFEFACALLVALAAADKMDVLGPLPQERSPS